MKNTASTAAALCIALAAHAAPPCTDSDGDGLPDWTEALISSNTLWNIELSPTNAVSDGVTPDYFRKVGSQYLGEMFTDHDFMEDWWEWGRSLDAADIATWDAGRDQDHMGWSKFARCRSALWPREPGAAKPPDIPAPTLKLVVLCHSCAIPYGETRPLVVKAYTDEAMQVPDVVFTDEVTRGVNTLSLSVPSSGWLREGRNRVVAYIADSPLGEYVPGQPFGVALDVEVGWRSASAVVGLTETSAVTPRVKLWEGATDRAALFGRGQATNALPSARLARARVSLSSVDGVPTNGASAVLVRTFDRTARDYIHEGDFLADGSFDIGWTGFPGGVATSVTYSVEIDGQSSPIQLERRFESVRTPATTVGWNGDSVCRVAQPTFRWRIDGEDPWASAYGTTYTAFKVKVWNEASQEVYDSGYQRMPVADSAGVYNWTAPLYADCPSPSGSHLVFSNLCSYTWRVYTYNAKFKDDSNGSETRMFRMNVTDLDQSSYGFDVKVCYAGAAQRLMKRVRVQAFESPDFTGDPVAQSFVTNVAASALAASNGVPTHLSGLKAGTYFLRAYIDTDYDWALDDWESWGYLSERDRAAVGGAKGIFNPSPSVSRSSM